LTESQYTLLIKPANNLPAGSFIDFDFDGDASFRNDIQVTVTLPTGTFVKQH